MTQTSSMDYSYIQDIDLLNLGIKTRFIHAHVAILYIVNNNHLYICMTMLTSFNFIDQILCMIQRSPKHKQAVSIAIYKHSLHIIILFISVSP